MQFDALAKNFSLKHLPDSEVELAGEVPFETLAPYREKALAHLAEHMELPGFRPGKVPPAVALQKAGEIAVLEEAAELFIKDFYPELVEARKLDVVGRPEVRVTKLAPNNPAAFVIRTTLYPEVDVPASWKFIHEKVLLEPYTGDLPKADPAPSEEDQQKARQMLARNIRRGKLIDKLLEATPLVVPKVFVESELGKIMGQMREDIARMGLKFEDYLKHANKTEEAVRKDFTEQATKRAKLQLVLNKLAEEEKVAADTAAVEAEMTHALKHFPNANPELVRVHIETVLRNEKVLKLLEGLPAQAGEK